MFTILEAEKGMNVGETAEITGQNVRGNEVTYNFKVVTPLKRIAYMNAKRVMYARNGKKYYLTPGLHRNEVSVVDYNTERVLLTGVDLEEIS